MCGLVGIASSSMTQGRVEAFTKMLYMDTLRGWDSTGVLVGRKIPKKDEYRECKYYKRAIPGSDFIFTRTYGAMCKTPTDITFMLGHNRAATRGSVTDDNAHPFVGNFICLAHNGSLDYHSNLVNGKGNNYAVDSEAIMAHLDNVEDADLPAAIKEIHGAFALTWYDKMEDALYFVRNEERPLYIATIRNFQNTADVGIMWSSVPEFITYTAAKHNIDLAGEPQELEVGKLLKYTPDGTKLLSEREVSVHVPKKYQAGKTWRGGKQTSMGVTTGGTVTSQSGQKTVASLPPAGSQNSNTSSKSTATGAANGTTSSHQMSGGQSNQSSQQTTSHEVVAAGAPATGQYIEFAVSSGSFVGNGDSGQQVGWCKAVNGLKYVVTITGVKADAKLHGIYRSRITMRYHCKDVPPREGYSTDRFRVAADRACIKINDNKMAVFNSKHATENYSMDRDHKATYISLEEVFPKHSAALATHSKHEEEPEAADTRRFTIGEDKRVVDAYRLEQYTCSGCGYCGARVRRDDVAEESIDWYGLTPIHESCVEGFLLDDDIPF